MNAEFFALAFLSALNPKLLALDLLLIENRLAMLVGALIGIPGASYLTALHDLVTGKSSTATQVIAVVIFVIIDFMLIIIPFAFLELRPEHGHGRGPDQAYRPRLRPMISFMISVVPPKIDWTRPSVQARPTAYSCM